MKLDFAFLVMKHDQKRVLHVERQIGTFAKMFRIIEAVDATKNWEQVEQILIENKIQIVGNKMDFEKVGKFGRWASFIKWLVWLNDHPEYVYGVLAEDDVFISEVFEIQLKAFIEKHTNAWYFRCGPYNSCLVVKQEKANHVLDLIRKTGITMSDDWWSWKEVQILQQGPIHLVKQDIKLKSNIVFSLPYRKLKRPCNPCIWRSWRS